MPSLLLVTYTVVQASAVDHFGILQLAALDLETAGYIVAVVVEQEELCSELRLVVVVVWLVAVPDIL